MLFNYRSPGDATSRHVELERNFLQERVVAGLGYVRMHGTKSGPNLGRPPCFDRDAVRTMRAAGESWRAIAATLGIGVWNRMPGLQTQTDWQRVDRRRKRDGCGIAVLGNSLGLARPVDAGNRHLKGFDAVTGTSHPTRS